jgi:hypothetical protein
MRQRLPREFRALTRPELDLAQALRDVDTRAVEDSSGRVILEATGEPVSNKTADGLCRTGCLHGGIGLPMLFDVEDGRLTELGLAELREAVR